MEVKLQVTQNAKPVAGVNAFIIDGESSWPEIAATSNERGEINLPVSGSGTYVVRLQFAGGSTDISVKTGVIAKVNL